MPSAAVTAQGQQRPPDVPHDEEAREHCESDVDEERGGPHPARGVLVLLLVAGLQLTGVPRLERIGDDRVAATLAAINDHATAQALACERAFLAALDGSCRTPIAGHTVTDGGRLDFSGLILTPDGRKSHHVKADGPAANAAEIGRTAGDRVRREAGADFFEGWN